MRTSSADATIRALPPRPRPVGVARGRAAPFGALLALGLLFSPSCGGSTEQDLLAGAGGSGAAATLEQVCTSYTTPLCAAFASCFSGMFEAMLKDTASCVSGATQNCLAHQLGPGSTATLAELSACVEATGPWTCEEVMGLGESNAYVPPDACVLAGTLGTGAGCMSDEQCASARCKKPENDQECGVCAEESAAGGPCSGNFVCARGLACANASCAPFGKEGDTCNGDQNPDPNRPPCRPGLACVAGTCGAPRADGEVCDGSFEECRPMSICNFVNGTCEKIAFTAKVNEPCGATLAGGITLCAHGGRCKVTNEATFSGQCVPTALEGQACEGSPAATFAPDGDSCAFPTRCIGGTCRIVPASSCT